MASNNIQHAGGHSSRLGESTRHGTQEMLADLAGQEGQHKGGTQGRPQLKEHFQSRFNICFQDPPAWLSCSQPAQLCWQQLELVTTWQCCTLAAHEARAVHQSCFQGPPAPSLCKSAAARDACQLSDICIAFVPAAGALAATAAARLSAHACQTYLTLCCTSLPWLVPACTSSRMAAFQARAARYPCEMQSLRKHLAWCCTSSPWPVPACTSRRTAAQAPVTPLSSAAAPARSCVRSGQCICLLRLHAACQLQDTGT